MFFAKRTRGKEATALTKEQILQLENVAVNMHKLPKNIAKRFAQAFHDAQVFHGKRVPKEWRREEHPLPHKVPPIDVEMRKEIKSLRLLSLNAAKDFVWVFGGVFVTYFILATLRHVFHVPEWLTILLASAVAFLATKQIVSSQTTAINRVLMLRSAPFLYFSLELESVLKEATTFLGVQKAEGLHLRALGSSDTSPVAVPSTPVQNSKSPDTQSASE